MAGGYPFACPDAGGWRGGLAGGPGLDTDRVEPVLVLVTLDVQVVLVTDGRPPRRRPVAWWPFRPAQAVEKRKRFFFRVAGGPGGRWQPPASGGRGRTYCLRLCRFNGLTDEGLIFRSLRE